MKLKVFLSYLLFSQPLWAKSTVGLGNPKHVQSYQKYLSINNKQGLQSQIIKQQIQKSDDLIQSKIKLATKGLLMEDLTPSIFLFKEIANFKERLIFSPESKQYISESFFRLSNLERTEEKFWIHEGLKFDFQYQPSPNVFNPHIMSLYHKFKPKIRTYSFDLNTSKITGLHTTLFVNGTQAKSTVSVHPSGNYTLQFFTPGFKPQRLNLSGDEFAALKKVDPIPLNMGSCKNPKFITYKGIKVDEIYFSPNCIRHSKNITKPLITTKPSLSNAPKNFAEKNPPLNTKKGFFSKKRNWYIIAGGLIASALIISLTNQNKDVTIEPTHQ